MKTYDLETFLADVEERARRCGVADLPVDALRNKGGGRTENKRRLLTRAAARATTIEDPIISYFEPLPTE